jgi:serine/threonine protein kinase
MTQEIKVINWGSTSLSFTAPFLFIKYIKKYQEYQVYEREKYISTLLKKFDWCPNLLYSDDVNKILIFENVGKPLCDKKKVPKDIKEQFNKILSDMKSLNIQHNDIKIGEVLIDKNNKIYLCDFGWASINNCLGCGIDIYNGKKPYGIKNDDNTLKRLNLI